MKFLQKNLYGKTVFYPADEKAKLFLDAFPHSSGKRKSATLKQMKTMKDIGISFEIREVF